MLESKDVAGPERPGGDDKAVTRRASPVYDGFISYSHAVDGGLAPALQRGLQRFAKPWYRMRGLRVFRDDAALSANPHLWSSIEVALDGSRHYILLASPEAASSKWVGREAAHWLNHKSPETLLIAVTDGDIAWDGERQDFDHHATTAIPRPLYGAFAEEPRYIDMRWARRDEHLSLEHARFRDVVAELAAPLYGKPKDEIAGEEVRQHRRTIRIARAGVALLAVLTATAVAGGIVALAQRGRAIDQKQVASSRELAAESLLHGQSDPQLSLLLAAEAARVRRTPEALDALRAALPSALQLHLMKTGSGSPGVATWSPDGRMVVTGGGDGKARIWDSNGRLVRTFAAHRSSLVGAEFDRVGTKLLTWAQDGTAKLWPVTGKAPPTIFRDSQDSRLQHASLSPDGRFVATANFVLAPPRIWDARTGRALHSLGAAEATNDIEFSPDGRLVATGDQEGLARIWTRDGRLLRTIHASGPERGSGARYVWSVRFSPDGTKLLTGSGDGTVRVYDVRSGHRLALLTGPTADVNVAEWSPDGRYVAAASSDDTARLWDLKTRHSRRFVFRDEVRTVSFNRGGSLLVIGSSDGAARVVAVDSGLTIASLVGHVGAVGSASFSPDGFRVLTAATDGTARIWAARPPPPKRAPALRAVDGVFGESLVGSPRPLAPVVAVGATNHARIVDARTHVVLTSLPPLPKRDDYDGVVFDHAGRVMLLLRSAALRRLPAQLRVVRGDRVVRTLSGPGSLAIAGAIAPDGKLAATADGRGLIGVWDVATGRRVSILRPTGAAQSRSDLPLDVALVFSPDGRLILSNDSLGDVFVWDATTGRILNRMRGRELPPKYLLSRPGAISPDDRRVAVTWGWDEDVHLYSVGRPQEQATLQAPTHGITDAAFNSDGSLLATATDVGVKVWDIRQQQALLTLRPSGTAPATRVEFTPDGNSIATEGSSEEFGPDVIPWEIYQCIVCGSIDRLLSIAAQRETRQLTPAERATYVVQ